jgi:hypothetical protein
VRGSLSGSFLRTTGGALTGPLTISANVDGLLVLNRPDGADHAALVAQMAGADVWELEHWAAEPKLRIADTTSANKITLNTATAAVGLTGAVTISANVSRLLTLDRPDGSAYAPIEAKSAGAARWATWVQAAEPYFLLASGAGSTRFTIRTDTGLMGTGLIPLSMLRRGEASGENAGVVTILAAQTALVDVATAVDVAIGDRVIVYAQARATKGVTAGTTDISVIQQAGTATGVWTHNNASMIDFRDVGASVDAQFYLSGIFRVTGAGTLTLRLQGRSAGSNSNAPAASAELYLLTLRDGS